jgi:hypothetical protein
VIDTADPQHQVGQVDPTDGYIRLRGFVKDPPQLDGHETRDCFLRRAGAGLLIGCPTAVDWSADAKTMDAGWIFTQPLAATREDIARELALIGE